MLSSRIVRITNLLTGWRRELVFDGLLLTPPVAGIGTVEIVERAPLRRMKDILDEVARRVPAAGAVAQIGPLIRFATHEGEHAGLATVSAVTPEGPVRRIIGMVAGDDRYVLVDGTVVAPEYFAQFREIVELLTRNSFLALGEIRRRRFEYDRPPSDWQVLGHHHATRYYHPSYPRVVSVITVHEARPVQATETEAIDRMLFLDTANLADRDPPTTPTPLLSRANLAGQLVRMTGFVSGTRMTLLRAVFTDSRFTYPIHLDTTSAALKDSLPVFSSVVTSARPVPTWAPKHPSSVMEWVD